MKLSEFKSILSLHPNKHIRFLLPTGSKIPPHAHVTEVARIDKRFIDCGGTFRTEFTCRLQTWFADDTDHRLTTGKLLGILEKAASFLETENLEVDVEHEAPFISQFPIASVQADTNVLLLQLGTKHTACLAEDKCLLPNLSNPSSLLRPISNVSPVKCCS
ncbi:DUF6428 family protein [Pedosphaera parvula]|uniref:Uncharacterized protein n=1 Tax=Pedosphaera parvula (strain Ellin514) TaxID=320771 RepID=B9XS28_PEDPL|nr:DUF6428 family protein [Pedosphaera parvula]EEF57360.1 conserved hypothetical protein [Pedosphaera parvula Ellin514]